MPQTCSLPIGSAVDTEVGSIQAHAAFHTMPRTCGGSDTDHRNPLNSVRGMQVADGPKSSQLEWRQDGAKTTKWLQLAVNGSDRCAADPHHRNKLRQANPSALYSTTL
jgi:hypothetical protein